LLVLIDSSRVSNLIRFEGQGSVIEKNFNGIGIDINGAGISLDVILRNFEIIPTAGFQASDFNALNLDHGIRIADQTFDITGVESTRHKGAGVFFESITTKDMSDGVLDIKATFNNIGCTMEGISTPVGPNFLIMNNLKMQAVFRDNQGYGLFIDENAATKECEINFIAGGNGRGAAFAGTEENFIGRMEKGIITYSADESTADGLNPGLPINLLNIAWLLDLRTYS